MDWSLLRKYKSDYQSLLKGIQDEWIKLRISFKYDKWFYILEYKQQHGKDVSEEDIEIAWQELLDELCQTESEIEILNNMGKKWGKSVPYIQY